MAGLAAHMWLAVGQQGSGKSHYISEVLRAYAGKYQYMVILNTTEEFSEYANKTEFLDVERLKKGYKPELLAEFIRQHKSVHFEVANCAYTAQFVDTLCYAIRQLGVYAADGCTVLFLTDESQALFPSKNFGDGCMMLFSECRKFGIHWVGGVQKLAVSNGLGIHQTVLNAVTHWAIFPTTEPNNRERIQSTIGRTIPDPASYKMPVPALKQGGECLLFDRNTNTMQFIRRSDTGERVAERLGA